MLSLCAAAASSPAMLSAGRNVGEVSLWGSVRPRARPVALWELKLFFKAEDDMQRQLGLRGQKDQDDTFGLIAGIAVAGVVTSSVIEASSLPPVAKLPLGAVCSLAPFLALAAGVAVPQAMQASVTALRRLDPAYRRRQNFHEAGHFLVGHLLGLEVAEFNAASADGAGAQVAFAGPEARARTHDVVDGLTVLAMAGVAAEVLACGSAEGGHADVAQLKGMLAIASPPVTEACAVDDRIRWATLMALTMLQNHRPCLEALAERFEVAQDAGECIRLLEATARAPPPRGVESSD
mmetsp:Transcript_7999/g.25526  ORF Transcript_7999/g.25526 Transcript_7999/m.25526 type:complete len:293 (+) Transcript_7999:81-959(+)